MQHGGYTSDDTYGDSYAPRHPGTDGQNSYFGDKPRTMVNDRFRAITLSRNPELWQPLPAGKQHELENTTDFLAIEEELEAALFEVKRRPCSQRSSEGATYAEREVGFQ